MIRKLQQKFFWTVVLASGLIIAVLLGSVNAVKRVDTARNADSMLSILSENEGRFPEGDKDSHGKPKDDLGPMRRQDPEARFKARYFVVWLDSNGAVTRVDTGHIASVSAEDAARYALEVADSVSGYHGDYRYRVHPTHIGKSVTFLDCTTELEGDRLYGLLSLGFGAAMFLLVALAAALISRRAVRPVGEAMEKQQAFISDAGHELKTPLAIIAANTEVLELEAGKSQWTASIRSQVSRMNKLLGAMLDLSRLDSDDPQLQAERFDFSLLADQAAEGFSILADGKGASLTRHIEPGIFYNGDRSRIEALCSLLLDNAVKYAGESGTVELHLQAKGHKPVLRIRNSFGGTLEKDTERYFDRFYRADASRSRQSGGYGIGLATARSICNAHKAKIKMTDLGGMVELTVTF